MLKFEIPMFYTLVFYIEGDERKILREVNQIMKKYKLLHKESKQYKADIKKTVNGRTIRLRKDLESEANTKDQQQYSNAYVIAINTDSDRLQTKGMDEIKCKISTASHEIRHTVDLIMNAHNVVDMETPAYLTGWLTGEIISSIIKKD